MKTQKYQISLPGKLLNRLDGFKALFKVSLLNYPGVSILIMCLVMMISAVLRFTCTNQPKKKMSAFNENFKLNAPRGPSLNADALLEIISLQAELKTFVDKKIPSQQDSIQMEHLLSRITGLNQKIKDDEKN